MSKQGHVLVIPFPAQGHVNPLMEFSRYLAKHGGFKITFVNAEFIHKRIVDANNLLNDLDGIRLVSIPDGLGSSPEDDISRNDYFGKLSEAMLRHMPGKLEDLINRIHNNESKEEDEDGKIICVIVDAAMAWLLEVANKMGIKGAVMWPASAMSFTITMSIPRLINEGIVDNDGMPQRQVFQLSPSAPAMDTRNFLWCCMNDFGSKKVLFNYLRRCIPAMHIANWWLGNTIYELEPEAFSSFPKMKPIGPLMASHRIDNAGAQFLPEDSTCLNWLDQQSVRSVIYVAFGSNAMMNPTQFNELAHGLELLNRHFLWVVRPGITNGPDNEYPVGFKGNEGKIVSWAPQQKVLSHPAIAAFLSHCGWNSTIEGLSNGVPFLCWPYFTDQLLNQDYICDIWKVGLRLDRGESRIITRGEIKKKVEQLLGDENILTRSLELKEMAIKNIAESGHSSKNCNEFIQWLKA